MKVIQYNEIVKEVKAACFEANCHLPADIVSALEKAQKQEKSPLGSNVLATILENAQIARDKAMAICQDTGMAVVFAELGQDVRIAGGLLTDAIDEGVRQAYADFYFRKSVVKDPLERVNTEDNTPAVVHLSLVEGDSLKLLIAPKGFGSENMSALRMLKPAEGVQGVKDFVVETVIRAGGNPCPPIIVGVGMGGTMEKAALLAKRAVLRPIGAKNPQPHLAQLETTPVLLTNS
ncbi:MAG TPA: fumarate hydratase, partial [Firmicutes bacterium]|nr:fumarate hydratase [Bacillota bacterium]